jgi:hypothetical protein
MALAAPKGNNGNHYGDAHNPDNGKRAGDGNGGGK